MGVTSGWGFPSYCYLCFPGIASERLGKSASRIGPCCAGAAQGSETGDRSERGQRPEPWCTRRQLALDASKTGSRDAHKDEYGSRLPSAGDRWIRGPTAGDRRRGAMDLPDRFQTRRGRNELGPCELAHGTHSFPVIPIYHISRAKSMDFGRLLQKRDSKRFKTVHTARCKCNTAALTRSTFAETRRAGAGRPAERRRAARPDFLRRARSPGSRAAGPPAGGRDWLPAPRSAC